VQRLAWDAPDVLEQFARLQVRRRAERARSRGGSSRARRLDARTCGCCSARTCSAGVRSCSDAFCSFKGRKCGNARPDPGRSALHPRVRRMDATARVRRDRPLADLPTPAGRPARPARAGGPRSWPGAEASRRCS
jgi:hypothetical protein